MLVKFGTDNANLARIVGFAEADFVFSGNKVEIIPFFIILCLNHAFGTQNHAKTGIFFAKFPENRVEFVMRERNRRFLAPTREHFVGVVTMMMVVMLVFFFIVVMVMAAMVMVVVIFVVIMAMVMMLVFFVVIMVVLLLLLPQKILITLNVRVTYYHI